MSKRNATYFISLLFLVFFSTTTVFAQADSIPDANTPPTEVSPPSDLNPEQPSGSQEISTPTEEASPVIEEDIEYYQFEEDLEPVQEPRITIQREDPELLAALDGNPFGLIRDGKVRRTKKSSEKLPIGTISTKNASKKNKKKVTEQEESEIEEEPVEVLKPVDTSSIALDNQNPFRLEGLAEDRNKAVIAKKIKFNPQAGSGAKNSKKTYNPIFDTSKVNVNPLGTLKFTFVLFLLGFMSFIVSRFQNELADIYRAFLSGNLLSLLYREKTTILRLPYFLMYVLAACSFGTMAFLIINLLDGKIFDSNFLSILVCIAGIGSVFALKHATIAILSYTFPFSKEINLYGFTIAVFNFVIGIILLPFITFIAFAPSNTHTFILYSIIGLIGLIYIYRGIRSLIIANKYLIHNKFHFFMYLCTIEIAPLLILLKLAGL